MTPTDWLLIAFCTVILIAVMVPVIVGFRRRADERAHEASNFIVEGDEL